MAQTSNRRYDVGELVRMFEAGGANSDAGLCVHDLKPALPPREIFLLWQANRTHSPLAARAIEIAVDVVGQI